MEKNHYLIIGTLESYLKLQEYFGRDFLVPIYVEVDDGERLQRALNRERIQSQPKYLEICRRFLADDLDFSKENLKRAGITETFSNDNLDSCTRKIISYIQANL